MKEFDSALFNLDSLRTSLMNERDEAYDFGNYDLYDMLDSRVAEVENLLGDLRSGIVTKKEWKRIQSLVNERQMQRYITCLNNGIDESIAAGAFED